MSATRRDEALATGAPLSMVQATAGHARGETTLRLDAELYLALKSLAQRHRQPLE